MAQIENYMEKCERKKYAQERPRVPCRLKLMCKQRKTGS